MAHRQEPPPIQENDPSEIDPIWTSSRTARQIYALGEVEKVSRIIHATWGGAPLTIRRKDITRLLSLAASSVSLLTLPQTDEPDDTLPQGEERSEQFVLEVSEYFERLDLFALIGSHPPVTNRTIRNNSSPTRVCPPFTRGRSPKSRRDLVEAYKKSALIEMHG
ncbi:hypothetical protein EDB19DRAFT_2033276 [Suillus lakei]|nr:hypothetical protein EDB19DRAFT_2033276 [Suillus lakei]